VFYVKDVFGLKITHDGKLDIIGVGHHAARGMDKGGVNDLNLVIRSIRQAISEAELMANCAISSVYLGISGKHIRCQNENGMVPINDQEVTQEDVDNVIHTARSVPISAERKMLHVLPQEYKVDGQAEIKQPIGMYGGRLEANFHVVVGQVSSIKNIGRCIKSAGLDLGNITLEPLASSDAVLSQEEKEAGVALIDIGGGTTDLAIFKDGIIRHTAVIPFGGNIITDDIKEGCSIIEKQAELLKIKFGSAWPGENKDNEIVSIPGLRGREPKEITLKNLSKIIHARVVEIVEQAYIEIKNYGHEEQKKKLIAGIVLTGGGSQLKHLKQLVEYITGMDTRIGYPNEHLAGDSDEEIASPQYATAVGLLMNAIENGGRGRFTADGSPEEAEMVLEDYAEAKAEGAKHERKTVFDKWSEKLKDFLDNAE